MKKNSGITLVALVITIIILLILANISISTLTLSGYNNYVKLLDDTCNTLYKNSKLANKVQNLKIEDIQDKNTFWYKTMEEGDFADSKYYELFINDGEKSLAYWISSRRVRAYSEKAYATKNSIIKNITVEGEIIVDGNDENGNNTAGSGIIGVAYGKCKIINCHNNVNVSKKSLGREIAGVLGCAYIDSDILMEKCSNTGILKGSNAVGGIVARANNLPDVGAAKSVEINNSYNSGNIKTKRRAGGIAIKQSYSSIDVKNAYYLKVNNLVGIQNVQTDTATRLTEEYIKSEDFTKELNNNLSSIDIDINLNNWKYSNGNYPTF